jgi:hypothetical protein
MKLVAIHTGPVTLLDHIGPLAAQLCIPLITTEKKAYDLAQHYYPGNQLILKEFSELTLEYLAQQFDALLCGRTWAIELDPLFKLFYNKKMRFICYPHGNSDKRLSLSSHFSQDINLVYGKQMADLSPSFHNLFVGNYRYAYFRQHRTFYHALIEKEILAHFQVQQKIILYAPTWHDKENGTSFFSFCSELVETIPLHFNLIIKLHPLLEEHHPAQTLHCMEKYAHHPQVHFLKDFPLVYPLLACSDLYLGDFSSIGYDFLAFDKPLYFLNAKEKKALHACGICIEEKGIFHFIEKNLERNQIECAAARKAMYAQAFGEEKNVHSLKEEILAALSKAGSTKT